MHEVGLMHETLEIALQHARRSGATRIHALTMRVGILAGVEIEALRLAMDVVTQGTLAEGATLEIEPVAACCWCPACGREFPSYDHGYRCPTCLRRSNDVRQGHEFDLVAVEVS